MQSISLPWTLLRQEPGFLCGTRRGCVGGSGSITCCNSKALRLLGQLPQCRVSVQAGAQCPQTAAAVLIFPAWLRAVTGAVTVTVTAEHRAVLTRPWQLAAFKGRHISLCSCALGANGHVQTLFVNCELSTCLSTVKEKGVILTAANFLSITCGSFSFLYCPNQLSSKHCKARFCSCKKPDFASVKSFIQTSE